MTSDYEQRRLLQSQATAAAGRVEAPGVSKWQGAAVDASSAFTSIAGTYVQFLQMQDAAEWQRIQADWDRQNAEQNRQFADILAIDALRRGSLEAGKFKQKVRQLRGSQRAALAAQGIDVDSGDAADIQVETERMGTIDAETIKSNAWREAWGYKVQAVNYGAQGAGASLSGRLAEMAGNNAKANTLLTGGLQAVEAGARGYYRFKRG